MRLLLDTHVLLWWLSDDRRLPERARSAIADPGSEVLASVASLWEIVVKVRVGKLDADIAAIERAVIDEGFTRLAISPSHLAALAVLPRQHRDPFDHLLIAQAISEDALLVTEDQAMHRYPVNLLR